MSELVGSEACSGLSAASYMDIGTLDSRPGGVLCCKVLREVVDSTIGDVVQLVRTLPRHAGPAFEFRGSSHSFAAIARNLAFWRGNRN